MKKALTLLSMLFLTAPAFTYETINNNAKKTKQKNAKFIQTSIYCDHNTSMLQLNS